MALELTNDNFDELVINTTKPVLVDFWAAWCGPCRMIAPSIEELSAEFSETAVIGKVDVDTNQEISTKFGIRNIPTLLFFKDGKVVDKVVGVLPKEQLKEKLESFL